MTKISVTQIIEELKEERLTAIEIQRVLKARGFEWSLDKIESITDILLVSGSDTSTIVDEIMESLVEVWERYKIHNLPMPQNLIAPTVHRAYFRYMKIIPVVDQEDLSLLIKLGLEALDCLVQADDIIEAGFWKPLYARWYHFKYPERVGY